MYSKSHMRINHAGWIGMAMVFFSALFIFRSGGLYPTVFGDEYTYSSLSRLQSLADSYIPDYLYLAIYSSTNLCGDGYLMCARALNILFFVLTIPVIYAVARRYTSQDIALLIAVLAMLGPVNSYTVYYMPEAMYFFSFWVCVWAFFKCVDSPSVGPVVMFSFLLGLSSLVKPHAIFLLPGFIISMVLLVYKHRRDDWLAVTARNVIAIIIVFFVTKFGLSYIVAGNSGLTLLGNFYTNQLTSNVSGFDRYLSLFLQSPNIIKGHVMGLSLLFGVAIASVLYYSIDFFRSRGIGPAHEISLITFVLFANMIGIVALFTASVAGSNVIETALRLHMRYYDFLFPLAFIVAGAQVSGKVFISPGFLKNCIFLLLLIVSCYALFVRMQPYTPAHVDAPELRGLTYNAAWFYTLGAMSVACLFFWYSSRRLAAKMFLFFVLPLTLIVTSYFINLEQRQKLHPDAYDLAGLMAKAVIPAEEMSGLVVIGPDIAGTLRSLFYVNNAVATRDLEYRFDGPYQSSNLPRGRTWLLSIGDAVISPKDFTLMTFQGFTLARLKEGSAPLVLNFASPIPGAAQISGLSHLEQWGVWSDGNQVAIQASAPLPRAFNLELKAKAFRQEYASYELSVGSDSHSFSLPPEDATRIIKVDNPDLSDTIVIKILTPISPKDLGLSEDARKLGIGLISLKVSE
ncbi:ArnT family glycosyltransferase [Pseudomonas coleopterorum]|uniref:ArnT family glycosyltransferase n=1 Tax=Pseudomonas coleopterorum TaxID=1605838 RepID=UPI00177FE82A|nr:glycosyltransferase family 39 protein [Pseudomonas coleopterorum]MBD8481809.1 glycosyltransferase family 39 protein [Pseudomonas coleopterorum]